MTAKHLCYAPNLFSLPDPVILTAKVLGAKLRAEETQLEAMKKKRQLSRLQYENLD